jgi:glycosyltransferase involved in cell wall biosynthesis
MVEPGDVDAIAQGMVRLWEDETLRRELSARGLRQAAGFSWEKTARQTLAAYARG